MSATISISTAIELQFDKLYTELTFENIQLTRTLRLLLEDLEVKCITEATSDYTTEAEQHYHTGFDNGRDSGYEQGWDEGWDEGQLFGYDKGYDEGQIFGEEEGYDLGYSEKCRDKYEAGFGDGYDQAMEDMKKED